MEGQAKMTEQEEFEFRLRLEKERDTDAPKSSGSNAASVVSKIPGAGVVVGPVEAAANMASGMIAKPLSDVAGLAATAYDAARGDKTGNPAGFKNYVQNALTYQPRTEAGNLVAEYNPLALLGKGVNWLGQKAEENISPPDAGMGRQMLGAGVHEAINQAPQFLGPAVKAIGDSVGGSVQSGGRALMRSALKPTTEAVRTGKADRAISTLLDEGINVSPGGVEKIQSRVSNLNSEIANEIAKSNATVSKFAVANKLSPVLDKAKRQVNPMQDVAAIQDVGMNFWDHPSLIGKSDMPVQMAQEMKQGTYRALGDKSFGELKSATIEAQKALAKGLREEIAAKVPAVRRLNAEESNLLNALSVSERRLMVEANKNPLGLGWLSSSPVNMAAWMADRSGLFKSLVARMLNTAGEGVKVISNVPGVGLGVTEEANKNKLANLEY
jgi:hypothetical protein